VKKKLSNLQHTDKIFFLTILRFILFICFTKPGLGIFAGLVMKRLKSVLPQKSLSFNDWLKKNFVEKKLRKEYQNLENDSSIKPTYTIIIPVNNQTKATLAVSLESIFNQLYPNWELILLVCEGANNFILDYGVFEQSEQKGVQRKNRAVLYSLRDARVIIKSVQSESSYAALFNVGAAMATGNYVALMHPNDLLAINCLAEVTKFVSQCPEAQIIYSNEDIVDDNNIHRDPKFFTDWCEDNALSGRITNRFLVVEKVLFIESGGLSEGNNTFWNLEYMLRMRDSGVAIHHIPQFLYHVRAFQQSDNRRGSASGWEVSAQQVIEAALMRRNVNAQVTPLDHSNENLFDINYTIKEFKKVSIIIPTRDKADLLSVVLDSILQFTQYPDYEVIVVNNNSKTPEFFELIAKTEQQWKPSGRGFKCINANIEFNFSKLINLGVASASGEFLLLLNNDIEITQADWMTQMVAYAQRDRIGAVGVKLLFPDKLSVQHVGIAMDEKEITYHILKGIPNTEKNNIENLAVASNYSAVTGACLMCRKSLFLEIGGMDEYLPVEYNDVDLCLTLNKHGYSIVLLPNVALIHHESASRGHPYSNMTSWRRHERDLEVFKNKWASKISDDPYFSKLSLQFHARSVQS
jgi:O-antigen biosynthesis protein